MPVNKVKRNGSYAPLSAHYYKDDAIADAGEAAELLYVRGLAFCADVLSDGFISDRQLQRFVGVGMRDATRRADRLVEVGLWEKRAGGYVVSAWLKWNRSKDDIAALNRRDAERKGSSPAPVDEDVPPPGDDDAPPDSERHPNGVQSDSESRGDGSPNGFQPRARARARPPRNSTPRNYKERSSADADRDINAGTVVEAWVEEIGRNGTVKPQGAMKAQVGREARELLNDGTDPELVMAAARTVATKGYATLHREVMAMQRRPLAAVRAMPPGYDEHGQLRDPKTGVLIER